jgi:hypothetical protein
VLPGTCTESDELISSNRVRFLAENGFETAVHVAEQVFNILTASSKRQEKVYPLEYRDRPVTKSKRDPRD